MGNFHNSGPGFDPIQNPTTLARLEGLFIRKLFTLKLRSRNFFYLILMLVFGVFGTGFMAFALYALTTASPAREPDFTYYLVLIPLYLIFFFIFVAGVLLLINFMISISVLLGLIKETKNNINQNRKKKKMPKRRKDYK